MATLIGDALLLLPRQQMLYALGAFFLSHLLYTICFAANMTMTFYWPIPLTLLIIGAVTIAVIWSRLEALRWPICTLIGMTLVMTWMAAEQYFFRPSDDSFTLIVGASLLCCWQISSGSLATIAVASAPTAPLSPPAILPGTL